MNEEMVQQMMVAAARLAAATETLDRVLGTGRSAGDAECESGPDRGGGRGECYTNNRTAPSGRNWNRLAAARCRTGSRMRT